MPRPDRVESILPNFRHCKAQIMTTPALEAKFVEYEMLIEPNGDTINPVDDGLK